MKEDSPEYVFLPNGEQDFANAEFCGTPEVVIALGECKKKKNGKFVGNSKFDTFVRELGLQTEKIISDAAKEEAKKGESFDHIKRAAIEYRDKLLPKVKCRIVEHDGTREIERDVGRVQYLFTVEDLWNLKQAMHPPLESILYEHEDENGDRSLRELIAHRDCLPLQPRIGGKMGAWTREMFDYEAGGSDRYLPNNWAEDLPENWQKRLPKRWADRKYKVEPVIFVKECKFADETE